VLTKGICSHPFFMDGSRASTIVRRPVGANQFADGRTDASSGGCRCAVLLFRLVIASLNRDTAVVIPSPQKTEKSYFAAQNLQKPPGSEVSETPRTCSVRRGRCFKTGTRPNEFLQKTRSTDHGAKARHKLALGSKFSRALAVESFTAP
jgi:hypothetical protein